MNKIFPYVAFFLMLVLGACDRRLAPRELNALASEGATLNDTVVASGPIPASRWPNAIRKLRPERVYRTPDGLYITMDSFFVEERGLFVPDSAARLLPGRESDPSYESLGEGVFAYTIKG
ncbi:hypothetical protein SAMN05216569_0072 [Pseudoxanthomonas sp. CF125]|nr:hypothetical protein SAMN05216569_0072 [Pseudoxanthomonas sp. CF125]